MTKEKIAGLRFRSRSEHILDAKGRLNIPTRFREVLSEVYSNALIVTNWQKSLKAYPVAEWETLEEKLLTQGRSQPGMSAFIRYVISGVIECSLDKQGRILLPGSLRNEFGISKDVVLNGMLDHFEIWDKGAWQNEVRRTREDFTSFREGLSSLGIL
ncbi:MAG: division/cell wall cluster transcriptional repressor MraZ [Candidatus Electrothrix aestuarii]|uniref:Transcriptional regulator MraZ n=1 Tax=Candidatus Electrothrix aestuarii TaxID=3062594 RepID=A0AAU8LZE9_9BACT|nr:division/cell wall cluster transcriptional repressor MraZ [Candidatus Electrothrix aestuarii]